MTNVSPPTNGSGGKSAEVCARSQIRDIVKSNSKFWRRGTEEGKGSWEKIVVVLVADGIDPCSKVSERRRSVWWLLAEFVFPSRTPWTSSQRSECEEL